MSNVGKDLVELGAVLDLKLAGGLEDVEEVAARLPGLVVRVGAEEDVEEGEVGQDGDDGERPGEGRQAGKRGRLEVSGWRMRLRNGNYLQDATTHH